MNDSFNKLHIKSTVFYCDKVINLSNLATQTQLERKSNACFSDADAHLE
jgi:hypothetical protein